MKLNTGLLLSRPGESAYARYRQFLIANNSISFSELTAELKKRLLITEPNIFNRTAPYLFASCATKLEDKYIEENHLNKPEYHSGLISGYRPKRCCNKCASVGYHCELFDMPWLIKCPIHNENLTEVCNNCNQSWPTASEMISRNCRTCGVKITIKELLKATLNNSDDGYQLIANAQLLVHQGYRQFSSDFSLYYYRNRNDDIRALINHHSAFYLSIVEKSLNKQNILCQLTKTFDIEKKTYEVTPIPLYPRNTDSEELLSLRIKTIKKTIAKFESIFNHGDHVIGRCNTNNFPQKVCLHCVTFNIWLRVINYRYDGDYEPSLLALSYEPPVPKIYSTIYIDAEYSNSNYIKLPLTLSAKIYENDLWTTAMHLYQYMSHMVENKNTTMFWNDFAKNCRPILLYYNSTFSPYVMKLTNDNLDVYFLKNILTTKLNDSKKIDQLVSYSLNS